jgi:cbb3-type cytochrome oxidase cytochrome c subunit
MMVMLGVFGLFVVMALVGLAGPSLPTDIPGARSSSVPYSEAAEAGRELYQSLGCAACHTQMVRPVIADVGLGAVTLNDTNQVLGTRRFGPDLSDVGSRLTPSQIEALIAGLGDHPLVSSDRDLISDLVTYLSESRTSPPQDAESS